MYYFTTFHNVSITFSRPSQKLANNVTFKLKSIKVKAITIEVMENLMDKSNIKPPVDVNLGVHNNRNFLFC